MVRSVTGLLLHYYVIQHWTRCGDAALIQHQCLPINAGLCPCLALHAYSRPVNRPSLPTNASPIDPNDLQVQSSFNLLSMSDDEGARSGCGSSEGENVPFSLGPAAAAPAAAVPAATVPAAAAPAVEDVDDADDYDEAYL